MLGQRSKEREQRQLAKKGQTLPTTQSEETSDTCNYGDDKSKQDKTQNSSNNVDQDLVIQGKAQAEDNNQELDEDSGAGDSLANVQGNARSTCDFRTSDNGAGKSIKEKSDVPSHQLSVLSHQPFGLSHQPFGLPQPGVPFMTSVAAQAVMKSRLQGGLMEETFCQEDSTSEGES